MAEIRKKTAVDDFEIVSASGTTQIGAALALVGLADVFIKRVGGTGADYAASALSTALADFEASTANRAVLLIGANNVTASGVVTITRGPVSFLGTVTDAAITLQAAITLNLPDTDDFSVQFTNVDIFKTPGDDNWIFTQSGVLRLINCTINNFSGGNAGLFRQVAVGGTLKVFARNCTFLAAQDAAADSPVFLSLATSGTGLELHLDDCNYVRDAADPTSFLKCASANVRFVLENHTVLFGPRIVTTTFSIDYDGTSLMVDDKNNTGTATVHGEAAYSTRMDALTGVDIELLESFEADARSFVGDTLHILPGTYTWPATAASNITNQSDKVVYGDGRTTKIIFSNVFVGNRLNFSSTGNDGFVFRKIHFVLQAAVSGGQTFMNISTSDRIKVEECTFDNTGSNAGEFFITLVASADNCEIHDCEFINGTSMEAINIQDSTRSFIYNNRIVGNAVAIGISVGSSAVGNYIFGNHIERMNGSGGTTSIDVISNSNANIICNNNCRMGSTSIPSIRIDVGADDNRIFGNYGEHGQSQGDRATVGFTGPSGDQANINDIFDPSLMGKVATLMVGTGEMWASVGQALQHTENLHHLSYGEVFVFVRGTAAFGSFGGALRRNHTFIGLDSSAKIQWGTTAKDVEFVGSGTARQRLTFIDLEIERAGTNGGNFNGEAGMNLEVRFKNCLIDNTSSNTTPLFDCEELLTVEAEDTEFINTNAAGIIFRSNDVTTQQQYTFKNCVATTANNVGNLIEHINVTPAGGLIRILEGTDFEDVPVDISTAVITIHHDGTGRWDETSLTSGTITRTGHQFSTDEVATGTSWIDGSEIFRKVVNTGALPNATGTTTAHSITGLDKIIFIRAFAEDTGGNQIPLPHNDSAAISNGDVGIHVDDTNVVVDAVGDASAFDESHAELWYTKV